MAHDGANGAPIPSLTELVGGTQQPVTTDPAWQPPKDPLADGNVAQRATVIHREIPLTTVGTGWDVAAVRRALDQQVVGLFDWPAQLCDSIIGDSRVQAAMASRTGGLLGREVDFLVPRKYRDSDAAKECREAFADSWSIIGAESFLSELERWAVMLGFGLAQILWDTTSGDYAIPYPLIWHPRYVWWHWIYRCYTAVTQDGLAPITPGDGNWILHAPKGAYRGWLHGADRAIAPWWLARHYALRDWARYSERHGLPMIKAKSPARGDPELTSAWRVALQSLGQETVINLPQNVDGTSSFDVDLLEARDTAHDGFRMLISQCDVEITLALLAQSLTTDVSPEGHGSYAAARVHADVRQALLEADARSLSQTIYTQIARPFAAMNFGNADLAPRVVWNVEPYEDAKTKAETLLTFTQALVNMRNAGLAYEDPSEVMRLGKVLGLDVGKLKKVDIPAGAAPLGRAATDRFPKPNLPEMPKGSARDRFAKVAEQNARLRIALGESTREEIEAENEAMFAMLAESEASAPRRARRS